MQKAGWPQKQNLVLTGLNSSGLSFKKLLKFFTFNMMIIHKPHIPQ